MALPLMVVNGMVTLRGQIVAIRRPDVVVLEGTQWSFLSAANNSDLDINLSAVIGPLGAKMALNVVNKGSSPLFMMAVESVDCEYIVNYSMLNSTTSSPCGMCLGAPHKRCQWCDGKCQSRGSVITSSFCNQDNCCPQQCHGHGSCQHPESVDAHCVCGWLYAGEVRKRIVGCNPLSGMHNNLGLFGFSLGLHLHLSTWGHGSRQSGLYGVVHLAFCKLLLALPHQPTENG